MEPWVVGHSCADGLEAPLPHGGGRLVQGSLPPPAATWGGAGGRTQTQGEAAGQVVQVEALSSNTRTGAGVWRGSTLISMGPKSWLANRGSKHVRVDLAWFGLRKHLGLPLI